MGRNNLSYNYSSISKSYWKRPQNYNFATGAKLIKTLLILKNSQLVKGNFVKIVSTSLQGICGSFGLRTFLYKHMLESLGCS